MQRILPYQDALHAEGLRGLLMPILRDEHGYDITYEDMPDLLDIVGTYRVGAGDCWVATSGLQVVGVMSILDLGDNGAALRKFFVHRKFRRPAHDTAHQMLEHLIKHAKSTGLKTIALGTTPAFVSGHRFYEKSGFVRISQTELPKGFPVSAAHSRFYQLSVGTAT